MFTVPQNNNSLPNKEKGTGNSLAQQREQQQEKQTTENKTKKKKRFYSNKKCFYELSNFLLSFVFFFVFTEMC